MNVNELTTKRFVIRKSLIGKNVVISFTNKKGDVCTYNHDDVYNKNKELLDNMNCFNSINLIQLLTIFLLGLDCSSNVTLACYYSLVN